MTTLPTFSALPIASPLTLTASDLPGDEQARLARAAVGLGELAGRTLLHVRGAAAENVLQGADMPIGAVRTTADGLLARLRRDEFALLAPDGRVALTRLAGVVGGQRVTLTDITHGRGGLLLAGRHAPDVLAKVCALDFARQFPNLHAAQTSLAKVRTLIVRADIESLPAYGLIVDRSLAAYVWAVVFDAAQEFGGIALSSSGLDYLRETSLW